VAPLIVVALNLVYLNDWHYPVPFIDPTPLGLALAAVVMIHGLLHSGLLNLSPALHRQVIERLGDPVVVLDSDGLIIDANPAGARMLLPDGGPIIGQPIDRLLPNQQLTRLDGQGGTSAEIPVDLRTYDVRATRLGDSGESTVVLLFRDITERLEAETELRQVKLELERLAYTDPLTSLHNRRSFMERMHQECERVRRHQQSLSVVLLDLDRFKDVNDTHGHEVGDGVLRHVARQLESCSRVCDVSARLGGEEFALLLPATDRDGALRLAERLRSAIAGHGFHSMDGTTFNVTTSAGIATIDVDSPDWQSLLRRADEALYRAKRAGRNAVLA
jgi:diguanylate cyclase (GGDEF)-like protein